MAGSITRKPIIGVMPLVDDEKESLWMVPGYLKGIEQAGGIPFIFPLTSCREDIEVLMDKVDGILLTGGHDVSPSLYHQNVLFPVETSKDRDKMESIVLELALKTDKSVLGICRGIQFLNAYLGGTLYQDLPHQYVTCIDHHQTPPYDVPQHRVDVLKDTPLYELLKSDTLSVNSYHHQAINELSKELKPMAISSDGLMEAVYLPNQTFVWAVQWHPEFNYKVEESSRLIFNEFIKKSLR